MTRYALADPETKLILDYRDELPDDWQTSKLEVINVSPPFRAWLPEWVRTELAVDWIWRGGSVDSLPNELRTQAIAEVYGL